MLQTEIEVEWEKCSDGLAFCPLETVNLIGVDAVGVYVIWHSPSRRVVHVGQGAVALRLSEHRGDPSILGHRGDGSLLVTWASIADEETRLGVERYLGELWKPLASTRFSEAVPPIPVNLPA